MERSTPIRKLAYLRWGKKKRYDESHSAFGKEKWERNSKELELLL